MVRLTVRRIQPNTRKKPSKKELELLYLQRKRQKLLSDDIVTEVRSGVNILKNRLKNDVEIGIYEINTPYFVDNSVLRILYYDRIEDESERDAIIEDDVRFVYAEVRRLNDTYKLWNVSIHQVWRDDRKTHVLVVKEQ